MDIIDTKNSMKLYGLKNPRDFTLPISEHRNRFVVKDGETIVCRGIGMTPEFVEDSKGYASYSKQMTGSVKYSKSEEGSLVILYNWEKEWHLSTLRKLNAFNSYWGGPVSFGTKFLSALKFHKVGDTFAEFTAKLDSNLCYHFLLRNDMYSRLVNYPDKNRLLVFLGASDRDFTKLSNPSLNLPTPEYVTPGVADSLDHVHDWIKTNINYMKRQGLIGVDSKGRRIKIIHPSYTSMLNLRNNSSDLRLRYIELRTKPHSKTFQDFMYLFSEFCYMFSEIEAHLIQVAIELIGVYRKRYILKRYWKVPPLEHMVLKNAFTQYKNTNITYDNICNELSKLQPYQLLKLYQRHKKMIYTNSNHIPTEKSSLQSSLLDFIEV